jgi:hypothetical protein
VRQNGWVYPAVGRGKDFASELDDMMISGRTVVSRPMMRFELQEYEKSKYRGNAKSKKNSKHGIDKASSELLRCNLSQGRPNYAGLGNGVDCTTWIYIHEIDDIPNPLHYFHHWELTLSEFVELGVFPGYRC